MFVLPKSNSSHLKQRVYINRSKEAQFLSKYFEFKYCECIINNACSL